MRSDVTHLALSVFQRSHRMRPASYLCTAGWTSSSPGGGSCRTGAPGEWEACRWSAPRSAAHTSGPPPGARRAQAWPLCRRGKESRPPAWGLPERDSSSPRIGQLSWGDPRRSGGTRGLGCCSSRSRSSSSRARGRCRSPARVSVRRKKNRATTKGRRKRKRATANPLFSSFLSTEEGETTVFRRWTTHSRCSHTWKRPRICREGCWKKKKNVRAATRELCVSTAAGCCWRNWRRCWSLRETNSLGRAAGPALIPTASQSQALCACRWEETRCRREDRADETNKGEGERENRGRTGKILEIQIQRWRHLGLNVHSGQMVRVYVFTFSPFDIYSWLSVVLLLLFGGWLPVSASWSVWIVAYTNTKIVKIIILRANNHKIIITTQTYYNDFW